MQFVGVHNKILYAESFFKIVMLKKTMGEETYTISWDTFGAHLTETAKRLYETKISADVTLISDDLTEFPTHKFILCAGSNILYQLFSKTDASNLYLKGIHDQQLEAILQYLYLGQTTVNEGNLKEFLNVAKDLEIKDLDNPLDSRYDSFNEEPIQPVNHIKVEMSSEEQIDNFKVTTKDSDGKFKCAECDLSYNRKNNLNQHIGKVHKGITYSCMHCNKEYNQKSHLKRHVLGTHEKQKLTLLSCEKCERTFNQRDHLLRHIKNTHNKDEQPKIPCGYCERMFILSSDLKRHINVMHDQ